MQSQDLIQPQSCTARRKNGNVCRMHGGGAPQVKAAGAARLRAIVDPALGILGYAMKRQSRMPIRISQVVDEAHQMGTAQVQQPQEERSA